MANLNIAKMVCQREGSHASSKIYKRNEQTGEVVARQCTRCGLVRWTS